jgi:hypothetical protein
MRNIRNLSRIRTMIRRSGYSFKNTPTVDFPIPVTFFYRDSTNGSVGSFWPKGNRDYAVSKMYRFFFALGLEGFLAHGKLTIYTDLPTATCLQHQRKQSFN